MADKQDDLSKRFTEVLNTLSDDKKKELYKHLKSISPEEREKTMAQIIERYDRSQKPKTEVKKSPSKPPVKKTKKKLKKSVVNAIRGFIAVLIIALAGVIGFLNKDRIADLINKMPEEETTAVSESVESSEVTETTADPTPTPTPTPSPTPAPTSVPLADNAPDLTGLTIVIDPGHQAQTNEETELCAEWLTVEKPRCTSGTEGVVTGIAEYELTLEYALVARDYLEQCGATVILTREENDVDISNQERAAVAVDNSADVFIRIHADGANDSLTSGVRVYVPDSGSYSADDAVTGNILGQKVADAEGLEFEETMQTYLYTGLNYANSVHSFQISLGFLSNSDDEAILTEEDNMVAVAAAISEFCEEFK